MSEINDNQHGVADPLRLDRCPDCGYSLTGLPEEGVCPECGFAYNPDMIVLYGWAGWGHGGDATRRRTVGWWIGTVLASALILSLFGAYGAVLLVAYWGWMIYRRRQLSLDTPAPVQLRLFPDGFGQRDGLGPVELHPWRGDKLQFEFQQLAPHRYRIRSKRFWAWRAALVNFEFQSLRHRVKQITARIDKWRRQAAG